MRIMMRIMMRNSNTTTAFDQGYELAKETIKKAFKKHEPKALDSGDRESFWDGFKAYFCDDIGFYEATDLLEFE